MASTSIGVQVAVERNIITDAIAAILEKLHEEEKRKLNSWLPLIEEHAEQLILGLKRKTISKRRPDILAAASLYDAFLEFESRTTVKIRLPLLKETLNLKLCSISSAWMQLFDNRAILRRDYLNPVYSNGSFSHQDAVAAVLANIRRAIVDMTVDVKAWITEIHTLACKYLEEMDQSNAAKYDSVVVGTAAIYAAIRSSPGKPRVLLSQRDLSQFCYHSPALLSKVWLELFVSGK